MQPVRSFIGMDVHKETILINTLLRRKPGPGLPLD
jgi:hypothetical protein